MSAIDVQEHFSPPDVDDYLALRAEVGMSARNREGSIRGLANSLFVIHLTHENTLIGMGRVIGDGGCFYQINDIIVKPSYQKQGLGKLIMRHIHHYIMENAPSDSFVSLLANGEADKLYSQYGFKHSYPKAKGMLWYPGREEL